MMGVVIRVYSWPFLIQTESLVLSSAFHMSRSCPWGIASEIVAQPQSKSHLPPLLLPMGNINLSRREEMSKKLNMRAKLLLRPRYHR
jgi:hypothetical protein